MKRSEFHFLLLTHLRKLAPAAASTNSFVVAVSNRTDVGELTVRRIHRGDRIPTPDTIARLLAPLNLSKEEIDEVLLRRSETVKRNAKP